MKSLNDEQLLVLVKFSLSEVSLSTVNSFCFIIIKNTEATCLYHDNSSIFRKAFKNKLRMKNHSFILTNMSSSFAYFMVVQKFSCQHFDLQLEDMNPW